MFAIMDTKSNTYFHTFDVVGNMAFAKFEQGEESAWKLSLGVAKIILAHIQDKSPNNTLTLKIVHLN